LICPRQILVLIEIRYTERDSGLLSTAAVLLLLAMPLATLGQTQQQKKPVQQQAGRDDLGLKCAQILAMTSADYIAKVTSIDDSNIDGQLRGIKNYGRCYDQRTDRLAATVAKSVKAPGASARADFRDFQSAVRDFTTKALAAAPAGTPVAPVKTAYAELYQKQFRYEFYEQFGPKTTPVTAVAATAPTAAGATSAAKDAPAAPTTNPSKIMRNDTDQMTQAKNRFGELLGGLPDDKLHELHAAFGQVIGVHELTDEMRLSVYRYAIFLLEPSNGKSSYPPPF
jgi:hypothetical protein